MFSSRALSALLFLQSVLSPALAATSSSFKIQHLDGRAWKYDAAKDVIRLNSGYEMTLAAVDDTSVYGNSQGLVALLNTAASTYVRQAKFVLHSNAFVRNNYDFAWQFQKLDNGYCIIYNSYGGGFYVGYDSPSDSVLIVSLTDGRKVKWTCPPLSTGVVTKSLTNERQLSQSWYYDTVDVPVNYRISFDIKFLGNIGGWGSILHYTKDGNNCCSPGQRMPAVWTIPGSSNLHVRIGSATDGNWGINTDADLKVGEYVTVIINAYGNRVQVSIDGIIQDGVMPSDRISGPAMFYLADPWHAPANAIIKNYQMTTSPGLLTRPNLTTERQLSVGWLYDTVTVPVNYRISFDIKLLGTIGGWGSIFHYTKDNSNCCAPGNRMPAIWTIPGSNRLHVRIGSAGDGNWGLDTKAGLPIGQYSNVIINAYGNRVQAVIDGQIQDAFMPSSRISGAAYFYMADPFYASANAMVKNYAISAASGPILGSLTDERQLSQSWYYDTVDVPVNYRISFDIKFLGNIGGWGSILHYTKDGNNCCSPGQRMPAVWTIPGSSNLHVRIGSATDGNWGINTDADLKVGEYVTVIINAYGNRVQVSIDGIIQDGVMPSDRISGPAMFYLADPWHAPANAIIKNYQLTESAGLLTKSLTDERQLSVGWLYDTVTVPENYRISFDIKLLGTIGGWGSIFHYTKDNSNCCAPGQRMPAIWTIPGSNRLHVRIGSAGDGNWGLDTKAGLPIGQYSNVIINAYGSYIQVSIDGVVQSAFMSSTRISGAAYFYMADPFHASANALVKNYEIITSSGVLPLQNVAQGSLVRNWPTGDMFKFENNGLRPFALNDFAASGYPKIVNIYDDTWFSSAPKGPAVPATPHSNRLLVLYHSVVADNIMNLGEMTFYDASGNKVAVSVDKFLASDTSNRFPIGNLIDGNTDTFWHTTWSDGVDYSKQQHWLRVNLTSYPSITRVVITNRKDCCQARVDGTVVSYLNGAQNTTIKITPVSNRATYELWLSPADNGMIWNTLGQGIAPSTVFFSVEGWRSSNTLTTWSGSTADCKNTCLSTGCKAFSFNAAAGNCLLHGSVNLVQDSSYSLYFNSAELAQIASIIDSSPVVSYSTALKMPFGIVSPNQFVSVSVVTTKGSTFTISRNNAVSSNSTLSLSVPGNLRIASVSISKSSTSAGSAKLDLANISFNGTTYINSNLLLSSSVIDSLQSQNKFTDEFGVLTGQLADGTYNLKWPSADFDFSSACQVGQNSVLNARSVCVKLVNVDPANVGLIQAEVVFADGSKTLLTPQALNRNMFVSFKSDQDIQSFSINYYGNDTSTAAVDINSVVVSNNLIAPDLLCSCSTLPLSTQFSLDF